MERIKIPANLTPEEFWRIIDERMTAEMFEAIRQDGMKYGAVDVKKYIETLYS